MKIPQSAYLLLVVFSLFLCCKPANTFPYAIKDFKKSLQPYLTKAVSKGIVDYDHSIENLSTDDELTKLSQSEHPILRAIAFKIMLKKPIFNHFDLIMDNLDDTAIVAIDQGEWGIDYRMVADYIIQNGGWDNIADKNKTIDAVLTKHKNLKSAYAILPHIEPQKKYYAIIKEMAQRDKDFEQIENALYALAKFKESEDIPMIKELLLLHRPEMTGLSLKLMKNFPNETYLEIYEKYYARNFYRILCDKKYGYAIIPYFIKSVATYKNERSATILDNILNRKPFAPCWADTNTIKREIFLAIRDNNCTAYLKFKKQVDDFTKKEEKGSIYLPVFPDVDLHIKRDTVMEPIKW